MFISINCNDPNILKFLEENISNLSPSVLIKETNLLTLKLDFLSYENQIKISSPDQETIIIAKPFHFSQMISKINIFQQNYSVKIGPLKYFPFIGTIIFNDEKSLLSETQNQILNSLVCYTGGIEKKILYESIWTRDKDIFENKLDTHLTNLRNHVTNFSNYKLNFKTLKGFIKLEIN
tara:strand:- start:559 stop:1092 length:534 start_codon:yes stop_codon:yes gene_type:complete